MLKSILFLATSAVGIVAQTVSVNTPRPGDTISASSSFTVEVQQAKIAGEVDEISIFIGIAPCSGGSCDDVGQVLYNGAYDPQQDPNNIGKGLFEDFLVQLPAGYPTGDSVLTVFHIADTQAPGGPLVPIFDSTTISVTVST
ncbi:hypothetical protein PHLCEN_2v1843 [Hermanssonia centrifuga]|uniref:Uncharacterized protein n=1 Tax=Hermanssonia centrifuga TaxID=98765 RepID=A0A2R6RVT4_9APHY|nr:hypothetical protein PHLCEN_2v1843 [Hermanssonia centrifuga]